MEWRFKSLEIDVTSQEAITAVEQTIEACYGRLDILTNSAAVKIRDHWRSGTTDVEAACIN